MNIENNNSHMASKSIKKCFLTKLSKLYDLFRRSNDNIDPLSKHEVPAPKVEWSLGIYSISISDCEKEEPWTTTTATHDEPILLDQKEKSMTNALCVEQWVNQQYELSKDAASSIQYLILESPNHESLVESIHHPPANPHRPSHTHEDPPSNLETQLQTAQNEISNLQTQTSNQQSLLSHQTHLIDHLIHSKNASKRKLKADIVELINRNRDLGDQAAWQSNRIDELTKQVRLAEEFVARHQRMEESLQRFWREREGEGWKRRGRVFS